MKKILTIEGMSCGNCQHHVEEGLKELESVTSVEVNLETKTATVESADEIADDVLKSTISEVGYSVTGISEG